MKFRRTWALILGFLLAGMLVGCEYGKKPSAEVPPTDVPTDDNQAEEDEREEDDEQEEVGTALGLSRESGVYGTAFRLKVSKASSQNTIYYTLDGSAPTVNSTRYEDYIRIANDTSRTYPLTNGVTHNVGDYGFYTYGKGNFATVVRFLEVDQDGKEVARKTATYFVDKTFTLPVVSLSLPPEDALGFYNDIENESKTRAELEYFDFTSGERFALNTQIKVGGNWTKGYPYRTMNVNFNKDENGKKNTPVKTDIFRGRSARDGGALTDFTRFRLHSGGNAQVLNWFGDAFTQRVAAEIGTSTGEKLAVATAGYRPVEVYLNGEYWGMYAIREHYSDVYFQQNYGVDKDEVILLDRTTAIDASDPAYSVRFAFEVAEGDADEGRTLGEDLFYYLLANDLSVDVNYEEFERMVDVDSLIDMVLVHFYSGNWDFMYNNIKMWRTASVDSSNRYADGKWRFCLHDLDFSFEFQWADFDCRGMNGERANGYALAPNYLDYYLGIASRDYGWYADWLSQDITCLFSAPMRNPKFQQRVKERALVVHEIYNDARVQTMLNDMAKEIEVPMQRHLVRWNRSDYDYGSWQSFVQRTRNVLVYRNYFEDNYYPNGDYFLKQVSSTIDRFNEYMRYGWI